MNGQQYVGRARKKFNTRAYKGNVRFTVSPKSGVALETEFTLKVDKNPVGLPLKCEFAYKNRVGLVHLPTSDTLDDVG